MSFLVFFIIIFAFISLGDLILKYLFRYNDDGVLLDIILSFALGAGFFSFIMFILGITHFLNKTFILLLIVFLNILGIRLIKPDLFKRIWAGFKNLQSGYKFLWILLGLSIAANMFKAFVPPLDSDTLQYHLLIPKYYLMEGGIFDLSRIVRYSVFPQFMEMLYLAGMLLKGDIVAQLIHTAFGVFTAVTIFYLTRKYFNYKTALLGTLIFYVSPVTRHLSATAMVDLVITFYFIVSGISIINWIEKRQSKWLLLYAVFCAFSFGVKYTGALSLLWFPLGIVFKNWINKDFKLKNYGLNIVLAAVLFALLISPWLIRNYIYTGNPISPFLYKYLGGSNWNKYLENDWRWHLKGGVKPAGMLDFVRQKALFVSKIFEHTPLNYAVLLIFFFKFKGKQKIIMFLLLAAAVYILIGAVITPRIYRFYLPALALISIASACIYYKVFELNRNLFYKVIRLMVMLFLIGSLSNRIYETVSKAATEYKVIAGIQNRDEYLNEELDCYGLTGFINKNLSWKDKILSLNETRGYYFNPQFLVSHEILPGSIVHTGKSMENIISSLKSNGIEYVFYSTTKYRLNHQRPTILLEEKNIEKYCKLIATDGICYLYKIM